MMSLTLQLLHRWKRTGMYEARSSLWWRTVCYGWLHHYTWLPERRIWHARPKCSITSEHRLPQLLWSIHRLKLEACRNLKEDSDCARIRRSKRGRQFKSILLSKRIRLTQQVLQEVPSREKGEATCCHAPSYLPYRSIRLSKWPWFPISVQVLLS